MTDLAIVESRADRASVHICEQLRELADWEAVADESRPAADGGGTYYRLEDAELRTFDALHLDLERPADAFDCDPDLLVFASRHSGETGALLTGHFTGSFGPAEFGGDDNAVAQAAPNALAHLLEAFEEHAPDEYDVGMECTHHGPTDVGCPSLFAELGSGDEQWDDPEGAETIARGILALRGIDPHRQRQVVGFGGNHYAPRFGRIVRETPWVVGHIAADWGLEAMGHPTAHRDVLEAAFEASKTDIAAIDGEWPVLEETLEEMGYRIVSETWLREVGDRPLELIDAVESALGPVDDGVRFGDQRDDSVAVVDLPAELLETAMGINAERVRAIIESHTIAFTTENNGSRVGTQVAIPESEAAPKSGPESTPESESTNDEPDTGTSTEATARTAIVTALAEVLEEKYETVTLEDDMIVAEQTTFDPELARITGVPEGPKFGALADGEPVTVRGETINPERVRSEQTDRFSL